MQYHLFDTTARWQRMSVLIELGGAALDEFKDRAATPEFQPWFVAVKEMATIKQVNLAQADAEWLWDVLRSEPSVQAEFGDLPAASTPWFQQTEHFHVLNQGEQFAIGLNSTTVHQLLQSADEPSADPVPTVRLLEKLRMRPGKASRLECCNVLCELTIPVEEVGIVEREAEILRVEPGLVTLGDGQVTVIAKSLNQSLTIATRRLEPDRRSPSGHTYNRLVYLGQDTNQTLEQIRRQVETDDWEVPSPRK